jgi:hypothetical protein
LIQASRGLEREVAELRIVRSCAELARGDPRRMSMEKRFHVLSEKQRRRAVFRQALMRQAQPQR